MKNKKGQTMGGIIMAFIAVIVGLILLTASAGEAGKTSLKYTVVNKTYTAGAVGVPVDLTGQELLSTAAQTIVTNATGGETVPSTNYTITEGVSAVTGNKAIILKMTTGSLYASKSLNLSYIYGADGYIEDTGAIAIIGLIVIFASLAVAVIALVPTLRSGILDMMNR